MVDFDKNDGGPAFPGAAIMDVPHDCDPENGQILSWVRERHEFSGMTLRDWFAGRAMAAIIIGNKADGAAMTTGAIKDAYAVADLMIAERSK